MPQLPPGQGSDDGVEQGHPPGQEDCAGGARRPPAPVSHFGVMIALGLATVVLLVTGLVVVVITMSGGDDERITDASNRSAPSSSATQTSDPTPTPDQVSSSPTGAKVVKLSDHPIMRDKDAGLRSLVCELPEWRSEPTTAKRFFRAATRCLDAVWGPFLRSYDMPFTPPRLYFPTRSHFESDCGNIKVGIETAAYYCEGELFLPYHGLQADQYGDRSGVYLALIAHEYGHHVQELTGIMDAVWQRIYNVGETSRKGQELSRRKELQAQCFSGMFIGAHVDRGGSVTRELYQQAWLDQSTRGDDTSGGHDHGNNRNYAKWWRMGAMDNRIADCNTFKAPAEEVR